jgi:hypothetical protein
LACAGSLCSTNLVLGLKVIKLKPFKEIPANTKEATAFAILCAGAQFADID